MDILAGSVSLVFSGEKNGDAPQEDGQLLQLTAAGVPLFDCAEYTDLDGISGTLGMAGTECDVAVVVYGPANDCRSTPGFMEARASPLHKVMPLFALKLYALN